MIANTSLYYFFFDGYQWFFVLPLVVSSLAWFRLFPFVCLLGVENYWVVVDLNSAVIRNFGFLEFQFLFFEKWVEWF